MLETAEWLLHELLALGDSPSREEAGTLLRNLPDRSYERLLEHIRRRKGSENSSTIQSAGKILDAAYSDRIFGTGSPSMYDYYDNEVRAVNNGSHASRRRYDQLIDIVTEARRFGSDDLYRQPIILVVNDHPESMQSTINALRERGAEVKVARNSQSGINALKEEHFDAVISDIDRDGVRDEGVRFLRRMREEGFGNPLVFSVANLDRSLGVPEGAVDICDNHEDIVQSTWRIVQDTDLRLKRHSDIYVVSYMDSSLYRALVEDPELLKNIGWREFEKFLAGVLERLGYEIELQQGTKDGGVDILALKRCRSLGAHKYLVQAKRWANSVTVEPVRELMFLQNHHRATKACLATTSRFTRGAWELAAEYEWQLELRDYEGLKEWISLASESRRGHDV